MASQLSTHNSQLLEQHFDTLAETPEAVAKLRAFVCVLAVRGSLVPQSDKNESGAELLKRILDELLRWCDTLAARLTAAQTTATHLLDASLHQILSA